jgi:hypothetical protein
MKTAMLILLTLSIVACIGIGVRSGVTRIQTAIAGAVAGR